MTLSSTLFYLVKVRKNSIKLLIVARLYILSFAQSTIVISKSKGHSKKLRDIRTSTYQMCSSEEKTI